jgi:hypothetical protein
MLKSSGAIGGGAVAAAPKGVPQLMQKREASGACAPQEVQKGMFLMLEHAASNVEK